MARFIGVTWGMVICLALAMWLGGIFPLLAMLYITVLTYFMDKLTAFAAPDQPGAEFPNGDLLGISLGIVHFPLLFSGIWAIGTDSGLSTIGKALLFIALSLFIGQVSNPNAHELIHRAARPLRRLGMVVYASFLFGHHSSAHIRVHHVLAATDEDPNSAHLGETFFHFAPRAWIGSFRKGYYAEEKLRKGKGLQAYLTYAAIGLSTAAVSYAIAGGAGILTLIGLSAYAQLQLLLSDYVQHYGLRRQTENGTAEPVGPQHSWNAPHGFSSALMLNAPRHSDHHARPARAFPGLELDRTAMPVLPYSLPVMAVIALAPPIWHKVMDKRARQWAKPRAS